MPLRYDIAEETLGYESNEDPGNTDNRLLMSGSRDMLIDDLTRIITRGGYTRLGVASTSLTTTRSAWTWLTSTGVERAIRSNDGVMQVWLGTVDTVIIDAWTQVSSIFSATKKLRHAEWFDTTELIDVNVMVCGDANEYEWNGAVAIVDSVTATTITKKGTLTFAQARFYQNRNRVVRCVRTGTTYTYTGGTGTLTLTGIADTTGLVAGDILVQEVVTQTNKPLANHTNDNIFGFENQIIVTSENDNLAYLSKNSDYTAITQSTPRVAGEGATLTLDAPGRAINSVGKSLVIFAGRSFAYKIEFAQLAVGTTIAETVKVKRLDCGTDQAAMSQEVVVPIGDALAFISNEPALRVIGNPEELTGIDPKTLSNPIKPDFDAEDWTGAEGIWAGNILMFTAPVAGRMWMLNYLEDANGKLKRFWNPPQYFPIGPLSLINTGDGPRLHGHSNSIAETYLLFDGLSDGQYDDMDVNDKLPINRKAVFPYNRGTSGASKPSDRARLKTLDEFFVEGETSSNAVIMHGLDYDFDGTTLHVDKQIHGDDEDILEGGVQINSIAQTSLVDQPLGGLLTAPDDARRFHVIFDLPREDYFGLRDTYESDDVDTYWAITARGSNATLSPRRPTQIHK